MSNITKISKEDTIRIVYYLMAVDGEICQAEEDKFDAIAKELDSDFENHRDETVSSCKKQISKVMDDDEYYDVIQEGVADAIDNSESERSRWSFFDTKVGNKVVVWNLLTIAFSDDRYTAEERKLIKYVIRRLNLDKSIFLEMENTIKALNALDKEESWLKTTNRPFIEIEKLVNELEDRKSVINNSVKELISM